jgi:hypothetical protein
MVHRGYFVILQLFRGRTLLTYSIEALLPLPQNKMNAESVLTSPREQSLLFNFSSYEAIPACEDLRNSIAAEILTIYNLTIGNSGDIASKGIRSPKRSAKLHVVPVVDSTAVTLITATLANLVVPHGRQIHHITLIERNSQWCDKL